jgi:hypothetical protein
MDPPCSVRYRPQRAPRHYRERPAFFGQQREYQMTRTPEPSAAVTYTATLIAIGLSVACALLYVHWHQSRIEHARAVAMHEQAAAALAACRLPTEHEQMHIVVMQRNGAFVAQCMFVGSRGTYRRRIHLDTQS